MNRLRNLDTPLFFRLADAAALGLAAPVPRLGEAVRTHVRTLSGMQKQALVVSARTGAAWHLASDEGAYLNGHDEAPCPLSFLTTGMVCAYMEEIRALAVERGLKLRHIELVQDNYYTMHGSALQGTMVGGARDVELEARIESDAGHDALVRLVHDATAESPLNGLLREAVESLFTLSHNGRQIACGRVRPLPGSEPSATDSPEPDQTALPDAVFAAAVPAGGDFSELIVRNGLTPKTEETTGFAGSSLAEQQDRVLHVRGICRLRPDGIKQVEQQLFNPHGSIFHFRSEEAPANGGHGRAPDASTYISAGIGFCFMTQFGRYATITKKALGDCRIVQDTHFSLGGTSHATGHPGSADPVETRVFLATGEDDEFARRALDMAEQTCFLHALCRAPLKTRIRVRGGSDAA
jgi:hypothetical protein